MISCQAQTTGWCEYANSVVSLGLATWLPQAGTKHRIRPTSRYAVFDSFGNPLTAAIESEVIVERGSLQDGTITSSQTTLSSNRM